MFLLGTLDSDLCVVRLCVRARTPRHRHFCMPRHAMKPRGSPAHSAFSPRSLLSMVPFLPQLPRLLHHSHPGATECTRCPCRTMTSPPACFHADKWLFIGGGEGKEAVRVGTNGCAR